MQSGISRRNKDRFYGGVLVFKVKGEEERRVQSKECVSRGKLGIDLSFDLTIFPDFPVSLFSFFFSFSIPRPALWQLPRRVVEAMQLTKQKAVKVTLDIRTSSSTSPFYSNSNSSPFRYFRQIFRLILVPCLSTESYQRPLSLITTI